MSKKKHDENHLSFDEAMKSQEARKPRARMIDDSINSRVVDDTKDYLRHMGTRDYPGVDTADSAGESIARYSKEIREKMYIRVERLSASLERLSKKGSDYADFKRAKRLIYDLKRRSGEKDVFHDWSEWKTDEKKARGFMKIVREKLKEKRKRSS